jgi:hypothetical protein
LPKIRQSKQRISASLHASHAAGAKALACLSKCAPVPVPGHAGRGIGALDARSKALLRASRTSGDRARGRCIRRGVRARLTARLAVIPAPPLLELVEAVATRPARRATGVVVGVLVERNVKAGVVIAEDVTALPAMVTARKVVKLALAGGIVANA